MLNKLNNPPLDLIGFNVSLKPINVSYCNNIYVNWLNDKEVNQYLETRHEVQTLESIKEFVNSIISASHSYLFAIVENEKNKHIGNIKIGPIHPHYKNADISYFLGDKESWGKGYATEAVKLIVAFGFNTLSLHRIQASYIQGNESSGRVLSKVGFVEEGRLKEKYILNDEYRDCIIMGILNSK